MEVYYECWQCKEEHLAKDITEECPTPTFVDVKCPNCGKSNNISEQVMEKWLEDRVFEVKNTSHPKWHIKDVKSVDDLISEHTLYYKGLRIFGYQGSYYRDALRTIQQWIVKNGFQHAPKEVLKVTVSYKHVEGNSHYYADDELIGYFGTQEAVEAAIEYRRTWYKPNDWLTRDHFKVVSFDPNKVKPTDR